MPDIPTPDEARDWLKAHGSAPDISMRWDVAPEGDDSIVDAICDILFRPRSKPNAA